MTAVGVEGSQAGESGNLVSVGVAELWQMSQEGGRGDRPDAFDGLKSASFITKGRSGSEQSFDGRFQDFDLRIDGAKLRAEKTDDGLVIRMLKAALKGDAGLNELLASIDEFGQFTHGGIGRSAWLRLHGQAKGVDQASVDLIGLGVLAASLSKATNAGGIKDADGTTNEVAGIDQRSFVTAAGFDQKVGAFGEFSEQLFDVGRGVGDPLGGSGVGKVEIGFADIDTEVG